MKFGHIFALKAVLFTSIALAVTACSTIQPSAQKAASPEQTKAVLWVGNSFFYYNNSMHGHVGQLVRGSAMADKTGHRGVSATISGSGINWHDLESHFKPNGVGSYSFNAKNEVVFNTFTKPFDVVLMMDCSQCPIHPQLRTVFYEHAKKNSYIARKHGARPAFFMSWAYADAPEMTEQLATEYTNVGRANNALVVPAGRTLRHVQCWRRSIKPIQKAIRTTRVLMLRQRSFCKRSRGKRRRITRSANRSSRSTAISVSF
jgi:hypothetical protein